MPKSICEISTSIWFYYNEKKGAYMLHIYVNFAITSVTHAILIVTRSRVL